MIISHDYKFIFIKTNKTGGTSVEIALSKFCGPRDVITPISPRDEKTRKSLGHRGPQNFHAPYSDYSIQDWVRLIRKRRRKIRYYNHISAREIKEYVGDEVWNNYYKFCFERNPWDRVVSMYYWLCRSEPKPTIAEFLDSDKVLLLKRRGLDLYTIDDKVVVDRICQFENLQEELESVCREVGIRGTLELPHAKAGSRKGKRNYHDVLGAEERSRISEMFRDEIALLGYEF